tara:strand:- start:972 stop:2420 length:1449 start_codon:yes stop_codon:yes gene_type:complete
MNKKNKKVKKKVVFVSGHFNVIHPGHLRVFRFAKEHGDYLVVGLETDLVAGKDAYVPEKMRLEGLTTNSFVDEVIMVDKPIEECIKELKPDVVVKGKEFELRENPEKDVLETYGGKLLFSSGDTVFSSIDLLRKEVSESNSALSIPEGYLSRHSLEKNKLIKIINNFKGKKVCVVGDLIVDEYITCDALGMSQEEPTLVVTPIDSTRFIGGAGIVAAHASGLGSNVTLLTLRGDDEVGQYAENLLSDLGVNTNFVIDENRPTTLKQRFRSKGKSLLRVSHLRQSSINKTLQESIIKNISSIVGNLDLLVFSDFNYGCLPQDMVDKIIKMCKENKVMLAADSQSSSQQGDVSRFQGMDLITPTEREARLCINNYEDGLVIIADKLRQRSNCKNILLKLGEEGLIILGPGEKNWLTDRIGAVNNSPKDVSGAGDSLLITSILSLSGGASIWETSLLGSLAAGIQVGRVGNTPIKAEELILELSQ